MTSKERLMAACSGEPADHVPLITWSFGFPAPAHLRWETQGQEVTYWYTQRLEHIHTLPQPWTLEDDFRRFLAWQSLGVDDTLEVSIPWGTDPEVTWQDSRIPAGEADPRYPVLIREYQTPGGPLQHAVKQTDPEPPGWVIQSEHVEIFEDLNIPRATDHLVTKPREVPAFGYLYQAPDEEQRQWFAARMQRVRAFAEEHGAPVMAWPAFGMDAVVWIMGAEEAIMMALLEPQAFGELIDLVAETDLARTELAAAEPGVDIVCQRGWYSSTDFWSPDLFDEFVYPHLTEMVATAHRHEKKFAYTMSTGVEKLGPRLADAGVDVLYFVDPVQDGLPVETARDLFGERMTIVGGTNALTLQSDGARIRQEVRRALEVLGPTNRFILLPVDALYPDTPWAGVECMIETWEEYRAV